ncbi:TIGR03826 family flagellar region protein [Alicyclobacillus acidocaldarius]|uniref:TIGR03826 family flagellar region protein n=1 Tax=Alicyclobacillus acidocaldarius TaxID=405212 RepID=UPI001ED8DB51|nr:TIGR03826 family flagellar region protein [Alicyclobacillus acidocaldarius]
MDVKETGGIGVALANCRRCGRLFNKTSHDVCPSCIHEEENKIAEIRDYLREHPLANIYEVSQGTSATYEEIVDLIRRGKLLLRQYPNMTYPCERCGAPTQSGRLCMNCAQELSSEIQMGERTYSANKPYKENHNRGFYSRE